MLDRKIQLIRSAKILQKIVSCVGKVFKNVSPQNYKILNYFMKTEHQELYFICLVFILTQYSVHCYCFCTNTFGRVYFFILLSSSSSSGWSFLLKVILRVLLLLGCLHPFPRGLWWLLLLIAGLHLPPSSSVLPTPLLLQCLNRLGILSSSSLGWFSFSVLLHLLLLNVLFRLHFLVIFSLAVDSFLLLNVLWGRLFLIRFTCEKYNLINAGNSKCSFIFSPPFFFPSLAAWAFFSAVWSITA